MALNPQTAAFLATLFAGVDPEAPVKPPSPATSRAGYLGIAAAFGPGPALQSVQNTTIAGSLGEIPIRIYRDQEQNEAPCLVYYHAGGWVIGDLDTHDHQCRQLAQLSGATVISVDYRLAPEHPFPSGHIDSLDALRYIASNPDEFDIDPKKIAIGGDSAGGNLAAYLAICARAEGISARRYRSCCIPSPIPGLISTTCTTSPTHQLMRTKTAHCSPLRPCGFLRERRFLDQKRLCPPAIGAYHRF